MQSFLWFANAVRGTLTAAERHRQARVSGAPPPSSQRSPLETTLMEVGLEIPNLEGVLAGMLGNTPEARTKASIIVSSGDAAPIFVDFAHRCAAWAPPSAESAASPPPPTESSSTPPPPAGSTSATPPPDPGVVASDGPFFHPPQAGRQGPVPQPSADPRSHVGPQPTPVWSGHAHAGTTTAGATRGPGHTRHAAPVAAWPAFRPEFAPNAGPVTQPHQPHQPHQVTDPPPPPRVPSKSAARPGWGGIDKLPTRPRAAAAASASRASATSTRRASSASTEPMPAPASGPSRDDASDPSPSPSVAPSSVAPPALVEWMKDKLAAIELARAAERAELAELRGTLAEIVGRLSRLERVVEAIEVRSRSSEMTNTIDIDEPADADPVAPAVSLAIDEAAVGDVEVTSDDDKNAADDAPVLEIVDSAPEPLVEDTTTLDSDEAALATIEITAPADGAAVITASPSPVVDPPVDTDAAIDASPSSVVDPPIDTPAVITASPRSVVDPPIEATEELVADAAAEEVTADHPAGDDEGAPGQPAEASPSEPTISVAPSDEPPGPIPPELLDTVRRIQLLEQQSAAESAEVAHLTEIAKRALVSLPPSSG